MVAAIQSRGWRARTVLLVLLTCSVAFSDVVVREYNDGKSPFDERRSPQISIFAAVFMRAQTYKMIGLPFSCRLPEIHQR